MSGDGQVKGTHPAVGQECQTDRSTLKPIPSSSLASVKVNPWKIAVGPGLKGPSPVMFNPRRQL